jgi:hypothetical protein
MQRRGERVQGNDAGTALRVGTVTLLLLVTLAGCPKPSDRLDAERDLAAVIVNEVAYLVEKATACAASYARPRDADVEASIAAHRLKSAIHAFTRGDYISLEADRDAALEAVTLACRGVPADQYPQDWK